MKPHTQRQSKARHMTEAALYMRVFCKVCNMLAVRIIRDALLSTTMTRQMELCAIAARPATSASTHFLPAGSALGRNASKALMLAGKLEGPILSTP